MILPIKIQEGEVESPRLRLINRLKKLPLKWLVVTIAILLILVTIIYLVLIKQKEPLLLQGLQGYFQTKEKSLGDHLELRSMLAKDQAGQDIFALAQEKGFTRPEKTIISETIQGVETSFTPLTSNEGRQVTFTYSQGFGTGRAGIQEIDLENNTLTTYNDNDSGIITDLSTGEVIKSWGPLTHHSDLYDYDLKKAKRNYFIWRIGLQGNLAKTGFEFACGHILPENILETALDTFLDPGGLFAQQVGCAFYLGMINQDLNDKIQDGSVAGYLPDAAFVGGSLSYEYGKLSLEVSNVGMGYSDSFEASLFSKVGEGSWTFVESKMVQNLRPDGSNVAYPGPTVAEVIFEYETQEDEILLVKLDSRDLVEETNEDNNQISLGRDFLNQNPESFLEIIYPNPGTAGRVVGFGGNALDVDGHIALRGYEWDFGNETKWRTEDIIHYTYTKPGAYNVRLRVLDNDGAWSQWTSQELVIHSSLHASDEPYEGYLPIVSAFAAPEYAQSLTWDGEYLWTTDAKKLFKINPKNGKVESEFDLPFAVDVRYDWTNLEEIVIDLTWDGQYLWLTNKEDNKIYKVDRQGNLIASFDSPNTNPTAITWTGTNPIFITDKGTLKIDSLDGSLLEIIETPLSISGMVWSSQAIWTTDQNSIYKLTRDFILQDDYPPPVRRVAAKPYTKYPFRPLDLAWDGKYLWVLSDRDRRSDGRGEYKEKWPPIIYKSDPNGSLSDYIVIPDFGPLGNDGVVWDGDGFLIPIIKPETWDNRVEKVSPAGKHMFTAVSHQSIYPNLFEWRPFWDIDGDGENFWLLTDHYSEAKTVSLDRDGGKLLELIPGIHNITSLAWDGADIWLGKDFGDIAFIAKYDQKANQQEKQENLLCSQSLIWINNDLWCMDENQRIIKMNYTGSDFSVAEIYSPAYPLVNEEEIEFDQCLEGCDEFAGDFGAYLRCANECEEKTGYVLSVNTRGNGLGWDGQFLWGLHQGHLYKLDHIPVSPDDRLQVPYFTHGVSVESQPPAEEEEEEENLTSDWETYKSEDFGFEFKHPSSEWSADEDSFNSTLVLDNIFFQETPVTGTGSKSSNFQVWSRSATDSQISQQNLMSSKEDAKEINDIVIGDKRGQELVFRKPHLILGGMHDFRLYIIRANNFIYSFYSDYCLDDKEPECDLILASFKFGK